MLLEKTERQRIINLVRQQVVPAVGCTEPVCVALCVAKAAETLGTAPQQVDVYLSANILKNAMGGGIPGTGMVGLPIAVAWEPWRASLPMALRCSSTLRPVRWRTANDLSTSAG